MKATGLALLMLTAALQALPQTAPGKYWVQFTDKNNTPFAISRPHEFLSARSIERRARFDIPVIEQDLPVDPAYIDSLKALGASVLNRSKWFNAVTIAVTDTAILGRISRLGFVRQLKTGHSTKSQLAVNEKFGSVFASGSDESETTDTTLLQYGRATVQTGMVNGHILHNQNHQGQGMIIAVLDAGFRNVNTNPAFDSLWNQNRILGHWDFVNRRPVLFDGHPHGAQVLSIMGGNLPGQFVGSAPGASYYLLITEDAGSEYPVEEDNWVAGAEYADSVGADLINSSLGYAIFDAPGLSHTYADMDGNTTRVTIGADIAASKGILVVNSAGNEGRTDWRYISAPADGDSVLTVGAVDSLRILADFSSVGPTADGRIKPNITGQGKYTSLVDTQGNIIKGSGTSFSTPLICGFAACLWQANRIRSPLEILRSIEKSASQANAPDSLLGYGIPDFGKAMFLVQGIDPIRLDHESLFRVYPNPFIGELVVDFYSHDSQEITIELIDIKGQLVFSRPQSVGYTSLNQIRISDFQHLPGGVYFLGIRTKSARHQERIIKIND